MGIIMARHTNIIEWMKWMAVFQRLPTNFARAKAKTRALSQDDSDILYNYLVFHQKNCIFVMSFGFRERDRQMA